MLNDSELFCDHLHDYPKTRYAKMVNSFGTVHDLIFVREQGYVCPMQCSMCVYVHQQILLAGIWCQHARIDNGLLPASTDMFRFQAFMHLC